MNINLETNSYINLKSTRANPVRIITNNNTHIWEFAADGSLTLPGDITRPDGININTTNGNITLGSPLGGPGLSSHFHIAFQQSNVSEPGGDLFLGDDFNYVKLPGGNGDLYETWGVDISTFNRDVNDGSPRVWRFGTDGDLTVPGDLKSTANTSIIIDGGVLFANVTVQSVDSFGGGVWRMFISSSAYPTLGTIVQVGDTATLAWNNSVTATITSIVQDIGAGTWALHSNQNLITGWYGNPDARTTTINSTQIKTWTFGTDRRLILPVGGDILDSTGTSVLAGSTSSLVNGAYILSLGSTGTVTFPDTTVQITAWTGVADYNNLINKPNLAGTYSFNVAADDSTLREISADETVKFIGAGGVTTASDAEGNITITGPNLTSYATQSYVTSQGYITSSALTGYALTSAIPTNNNQLTNGSGYITSAALVGLATETFVTSRGYITGLSWDQLTNKPNLAGTYSWSIAADDSTQVEISSGNLVKIRGAGGITTASDADGNITITGSVPDRLTSNSRSAVLNTNGTFSLPTLTATPSSPQAGQMALANGTSWDPIAQGNGSPYMVIYTGTAWIGMGGVTVDQVYSMILELG
jgi:hypothetical protein